MKSYQYILKHSGMLLVSLLIMVIGMTGIFLGSFQQVSEAENRTLQGFPALTLTNLQNGTFLNESAAFASDHIPARFTLMKAKTRLAYLLNETEFHDVYVGAQQELYEKRIELTPDKKDALSKAINEVATTYENLDFYMLLIPDKSTIQPTRLPDHIPSQDQQADISDFQATLHENIQCMDTLTPLLEHADRLLYYRSDHHWTSEGAYLLFQSFAAQYLQDEHVDWIPYSVHTAFYGTLAHTSGFMDMEADTIQIYKNNAKESKVVRNDLGLQQKSASLYDIEKLTSTNPYDVFLGGNRPLIQISTDSDIDRRLLLVKDSYANSFVPFLVPYFNEIIVVDPRYYYEEAAMLIEDYKITDMMFLYHANTLFADTSLVDFIGQVK